MDVLTCACAAYRMNNGYLKLAEQEKSTNKQIAVSLLEAMYNQVLNIDITDIDRETAQNIVSYYNGLTFDIIADRFVSSFDKSVMDYIKEGTVKTQYEISTLVAAPHSYFKGIERQKVSNKINFATGGYIGTIGERVEVHCEVLRSIFSDKWGRWYITAITDQDQILFFSTTAPYTVGKKFNISGTVKKQENNQTQLNRVKVL